MVAAVGVAAEGDAVLELNQEATRVGFVALQGDEARARGDVGHQIRSAPHERLEASLSRGGAGGVLLAPLRRVGVELAPEPGRVADEGRVRAGAQRALEHFDVAAEPDPLQTRRTREERHVEVEKHGQAEAARLPEKLQRARVIEEHGEFPFPADSDAVHLGGRAQQLGGAGPERVRTVAEVEAGWVTVARGEEVRQRQAEMRAVGQHLGGVEVLRLHRVLLERADLPRHQQRLRHAMGVEVGHESGGVAAAPVHVLMQIEDRSGVGLHRGARGRIRFRMTLAT
jgi:hypothetical protein